MNENLRIDENTRWTLGAVTNDSNQEIRNIRINPVTGRILVDAVVTSNNTSIGSTIPGATPGSIFFAGPGGTLDEDNSNLFYDYTNQFLGIGTNTPNATLQVDGTITFNIGSDANGDMYYRNSSGFLARIPTGSPGEILLLNSLGIPTWSVISSLGGYDTIEDDGTALAQRSILNFINYFTVSDGTTKTNVSINTTQLGSDTTLATTLANNTTFINSLTSNSTFQNNLFSIINNAGNLIQIDLATQVTGLLDSSNIDTSSLFGLVGVAVDGVTITGDGTTGNPLVAIASDNFTVKATSADTTPSFLDNKINIHSTDGSITVTKTITNPGGNEIVDYDLSVTGSGGTFVKRITTKLTAVTFSGAPTTFIIPHGLGTTPSEMNIEGKRIFGSTFLLVSSGYSNFSGINTCIGQIGTSGAISMIDSSSACLHITNTGGFIPMVFTATADSTNITLSSYTPNGSAEEIYLIIDLFI